MKRSNFPIAVCLFAISVASCGGGDKKLELGGACSLNSDCVEPLSCKFGSCHKACMQTRDCAAGERCVQVDNVAVCQLATEAKCPATGCSLPLTCGSDNICRNTCQTAATCLKEQDCVASACMDLADVAALRGDAGVGGDGAAVGVDGSGQGADAAAAGADVAALGIDAATTGNIDATAGVDAPIGGTADVAGTGIDVPQVPDLQPTDWGNFFATDAIIVVTAVAEPTSARPGEEITVTVAGPGIRTPTALTLGGVLADKVTITEATDVSFKAKLSVPHGLAPAIVDLGFTCQSGQAVAVTVLQVTPIAVSLTGVDTNRGTPDNPFRTYSKAVAVADVGDTIQVGSGEFSEGETWPAIPHKATVVGAGVNSTFFKASGTASKQLGFVGDADVRELTINGSFCGFLVTKPRTTIYLENVAQRDCTGSTNYVANSNVGVDANATGAKVTIAGKSAWMPRGIYVGATNVSLVLRDGMIDEVVAGYTGTDLRIEGAVLGNVLVSRSNHSVVSTKAANVVFDRATLNGEVAFDSGSTLEAKDSSFKPSTGKIGLSSPNGGYTYGSLKAANGRLKATLTNCTFDGGSVQVQVAKDDDVVIRGCTFLNFERNGVLLFGEPTKLDLGTSTDPGGNEFTSSKASSVYGYQDERTTLGQTVTISGTKFNNVVPPAGVVTKSSSTTACEIGAYCITTNGNSITFY